MGIGFLVSFFCLAFLHQKESAALGLSMALFGKDMLIAKHPWPLVDPIIIALPVSTIVFIVTSLFTKKCDDKHIAQVFE
jgi:SSS family solute:Na+ symporter